MKSVMDHSFSKVPHADIERSNFNRSHGHKTTFDAGLLIPIYVDDVLPGDTFNLQMSCLARMATPIKPVMDNMFLDSFFFFVPLRLIWDNFPKFFGEQKNPTDSTSFVTPKMTSPAGGYLALSLHDYFGLPTGIAALTHNSLFHRAYNLIWNEWFRDQNLQTSVNVPLTDGPDTVGDFVLKRRGKRHDYFTSCLPWPQKNNTGTAVTLPLGTSAAVRTQVLDTVSGAQQAMTLNRTTDGTNAGTGYLMSNAGSLNAALLAGATGDYGVYPANLYADLSTATASTINQIREAFQIQRLYERDARGGSRYTEIVRSHFGVVSPDARLQRPEYLGGGETMVNITPVPSTLGGGTFPPQATLAGYGVASSGGGTHSFVKSFTEHGVIIGMISVRADLTYQKGMARMFNRSTRFDYFWPALAHLGEQAVINKEIWAQGNGTDDAVFGYQERYAEYRYKQSLITGQFRSDHATPLDTWHLSQDFNALPVLNSSFIEDDPPIDRVISVPSEPHFIFDSYFYLNCVRPMPTYAVPGMVDHF